MMAHSVMWINVWAVDKLSDPSLKRANLSALEVSVAHVIKRYTNVLFTYLLTYSRLFPRPDTAVKDADDLL